MVLPNVGADVLDQFRNSAASYDWRLWMVTIGIGVVLLGAGWHIYRVCLVLSGIVCGVAGGSLAAYAMGVRPFIPSLAGGLLLGLLAVPLVEAAVFLLAGAAGGTVTYGMVLGRPWSDFSKTTAVVLAFLLCAGLSVLLFRFMVIFAFSVQGASLVTGGLLAVTDAKARGAADWLYGHPLMTASIFFALFTVGMITQMAASREADRQKGKGRGKGEEKARPGSSWMFNKKASDE